MDRLAERFHSPVGPLHLPFRLVKLLTKAFRDDFERNLTCLHVEETTPKRGGCQASGIPIIA